MDSKRDHKDSSKGTRAVRILLSVCALSAVAGLAATLVLWFAHRGTDVDIDQLIYHRDGEVSDGSIRDEALTVASDLVKRFPDASGALDVMGWAWYSFGDPGAAQRCWDESIRLKPNGFTPYFCMGRVALETGDSERAAALFRKSLELEPDANEILSKWAQALVETGDVDQVIGLLEHRVRPELSWWDHHLLLARAYIEKGQFEKAKEHLEVIAKLAPMDRDALDLLARVHAKLEEDEKSQAYRDQAQQLDGAEKESQEMRNTLRGGDADRGLLGSVYYLVGQVYSDHAMYIQAETAWKKGRARDPADVKNRSALALFYQAQGRMDATCNLLEELWRIQPENPLHGFELAKLLNEADRIGESEDVLERILAQFPNWAEAHATLAEILLESNRKPDVARASAQKAVELDPTAPHYSLFGAACWNVDDREQARAAVEKAIELDPSDRDYPQLLKRMSEVD